MYIQFLEVDASLGSVCENILSFFEMDNVIYGSFVVNAFSTVHTLCSLIY